MLYSSSWANQLWLGSKGLTCNPTADPDSFESPARSQAVLHSRAALSCTMSTEPMPAVQGATTDCAAGACFPEQNTNGLIMDVLATTPPACDLSEAWRAVHVLLAAWQEWNRLAARL